MNKLEKLTLVAKVYARRKKVADAKLRQLEASARQHEQTVSWLNTQISTAVDNFGTEMLASIKETKTPEHFNTFSSRTAAARLRHNDEVVLLRYSTLRAIETLEAAKKKRDHHKLAILSASQKTAKFDTLLDTEVAEQMQRDEAAEEEVALEAQFNKRGSHAG